MRPQIRPLLALPQSDSSPPPAGCPANNVGCRAAILSKKKFGFCVTSLALTGFWARGIARLKHCQVQSRARQGSKEAAFLRPRLETRSAQVGWEVPRYSPGVLPIKRGDAA